MAVFNLIGKATAALVASCVIVVPAALADDDDYRYRDRHHSRHYDDDRRHYRKHDRGHDRDYYRRDDYGYRERHDYKPRHHSYRKRHYSYYDAPRYREPVVIYRYSYRPRYEVGGYYGYHPSSVVIHDYDRYGLYAPPRDHYWVHDSGNGDAVLASIATGAIIGLAVGAIIDD